MSLGVSVSLCFSVSLGASFLLISLFFSFPFLIISLFDHVLVQIWCRRVTEEYENVKVSL